MLFAIDFGPGTHGHFLEYILNRYIFGTETQISSIFQTNGSSHAINIDSVYQDYKIVDTAHYSMLKTHYPKDTKKVIFIEHTNELDFVLLTNVFYRCHPESMQGKDIGVEEITEWHKAMMSYESDFDLKNNWYTKLMEHHFEYAEVQPKTNLPVYRFKYKSFFNMYEFLLELKNTANFLEQTFKFDQSLIKLWKEFIERNQGYNLWLQSNKLFENIVSGIDTEIPDDWKIHAYLNFAISKVFQLYDHPRLFRLEPYPKTTKEIADIIAEHVTNFDKQ